eukprot:s6399_g4.t2
MTCRHPATEDDATVGSCGRARRHQPGNWRQICDSAVSCRMHRLPGCHTCSSGGSQAAEGKVCSDLSVEECTGFILHEDQYIQCKVTGKSADESQCLSVGPICDYEVESAISGWFLNALMPPVSSRRLGWLQAD